MVALVLGGADCLWDDVRGAEQCASNPLVVACNNAGVVWPGRLDHWATLHPEELRWRIERRAERGHPNGYETWTRPYAHGMKDRERVCRHVLTGWSEGSSGFLALGVALQVADKAILCGIPMDERPHFDRVGGWESADKHWGAWLDRAPSIEGRVRSMSGRTRDLFGAPDEEWTR
jgi:hypothetical protein